MNIKHIGKFATGIATTLIVAAPFLAGAVSVQELQAQLKSVLAQISQIQGSSQVSASTSSEITRSRGESQYRACSLVARNLYQGTRGDDVMSLQEYLRSEGYLSASATGYYGAMTASAVAKWQLAQGLSAVGGFGPLSRAHFSKWCGNRSENTQRFEVSPVSGSAPLTATFSTWLSGFRINTISYVIEYGDGTSEKAADCYAPADACMSPGVNTHTYTVDGTYTATLNMITDPCAGNPMCKAPIRTEVVAKETITVGAQNSANLSADPSIGTAPLSVGFTFQPSAENGQYFIEYGDGVSEQMAPQQVYCIRAPCIMPFIAKHVYKNTGTYTASVSLYIACLHTAPFCKMMQPAPLAKVQIVVNGTSTNPANDPQCKSYFDGCNTCSRSTPGGPAACTLMYCANPAPAYCKAYFSDSGNKPPVISGISGPSTLAVGSTGTWSVKATDPENGSLSYDVTWGDEYAYSPSMGISASNKTVQTSAFTHSYANSGTYTVTVVVSDSAGQSAKTSTTVKVGVDPVACTMEYMPVCGQPAWSCPSGMMCATVMPAPQTYSNRCQMNAAGATFLYTGVCTNGQ